MSIFLSVTFWLKKSDSSSARVRGAAADGFVLFVAETKASNGSSSATGVAVTDAGVVGEEEKSSPRPSRSSLLLLPPDTLFLAPSFGTLSAEIVVPAGLE